MRKIIIALAAMSVAMPAVLVPTAADAKRHYQYSEFQGSDGRTYCRRPDGTTGTVVGAVGGALVGRTIDRHGDRTLGTLGGAVLGGLAGRAIERNSGERHCR